MTFFHKKSGRHVKTEDDRFCSEIAPHWDTGASAARAPHPPAMTKRVLLTTFVFQ